MAEKAFSQPGISDKWKNFFLLTRKIVSTMNKEVFL